MAMRFPHPRGSFLLPALLALCAAACSRSTPAPKDTATDAGTSVAESPACGDGIVEEDEACDDGNAFNDDACTNACEPARCGDSITQAYAEQCDDGDSDDTDGCTTTCKLAICGDGFKQAGEECDDGDDTDTDGCTTACKLPICGDSFVQAGEECDDGNTNANDACTTACFFSRCGDGFVETGVELCDDGNTEDTDACLAGCIPARCGDGIIQAGAEECDDLNGSDYDDCLNSCEAARCGDGVVHVGVEECDPTATSPATCDSDCTEAICGDGLVNADANETCDDQNTVNSDGCTTGCVAQANTLPVSTDANVDTDEDTAKYITLIGADPADGEPVTFTVVTPPSRGTLSGTPPNLTYTPHEDFHGQDGFTFKVNDGFDDSAEAAVSITVTSVNDAPLASAQSVSVNEDGSIDITLAGTDPEGDTLSFWLASQAANGQLSQLNNTTGKLTFTPSADFNGSTSFTFKVNDGSDDSAPTTVSITVTPVSDEPDVSGPVLGTATEDGASSSLSALANASDADTGDSLSVVNLPDSLPAGVTYNSGTKAFTLNPSNAAFQSLAAGATTTVTVNYDVSDDTASTAASVSWTVTGTNDAPAVSGAVTGNATEDGASSSLSALANASDADTGDSLSVVNLPDSLPAGVTYNSGTKAFTLNPSNAAFQSLAAGATTTVTVNYDVSDDTASTAASAAWTVTGTNDAPAATAQSVDVDKDTAKAITLAGTDVDGKSLTYTVVTQPQNGALSGNGSALTYTPYKGYTGGDSFTFKVNDGATDSAAATVTLNVKAGSTACGNGTIESNEACDDGNTDDTDDCMSGCRRPAPLTRTFGPVSLQPDPMRPIINIYLVSPGGALQAELAYDQLGTPDSAGDLRPTDPYPYSDHFATIRVFDPDEKIVHWHAQAQASGEGAPQVRPSPVEPPPSGLRFERGAMRGYRISLARAGVHQIRIATNSLKGAVALRLPDGVGWGFAIPSGRMLWPLCGQGCATEAASLFAWAPRHKTAALLLNLEVTGGAVPVTRLGDAAPMNGLSLGNVATYVVPPGQADDGEVWRLDLPALTSAAPRVTVGASGMPLILCDSELTARSVRASVVRVVAAGGAETLVSHIFQKEILELLPQLAAYAGNDATSDRLNDTAVVAGVAQSEACLGSPQAPLPPDEVWRRTTLLHSYDNPLRAVRFYLSRARLSAGSVSHGNTSEHSLRGLEFDGGSHFAGGVGLHLLHRQTCQVAAECVNGGGCSGGLCAGEFDPDSARWDVLRGLRYTTRDGAQYLPAFTGLGLPSQAAAQLTRAATWSHPCNPWGPERTGGPIRNPELLARAAMQGLSDLLTFGEDERQLSIGDTDPYPGFVAFQLPQFTRAFMTTAPALERYLATQGDAAAQLGRRVRQVWADGLRRALDRNAPAYLVSTLNQSSHTLLALAEFARGAEGFPIAALYRREARAFASRFAAEAGPAGWFPEDSGPDASYSGISHWHMAQYLAVTNADAEGPDETLRAALARSYRFLSHFSAVEPDGQRTSSTNFSHRTTMGFDMEQYHGALGVAEDVPEVAAWSDWRFASGGARLTEARASLPSLAALFATGDVGAPPRQSLYGLAAITDFLDSSTRVAPALLPSVRAGVERFETLLPAPAAGSRSEALAIGRPAYYAALYFGRPRGVLGGNQAQYWGTLRSTDRAVTREDVAPVDTRTDPFVHYRTLTPMVGGGLSILSTPTFGSALVAAGWSPLTHHGLVAELMEGGVARRYWEDYEQVSTERPAEAAQGDCAAAFPDGEHQTLPGGFSVYGRLEGRAGRPALWPAEVDPGLCYARHYTFDSDAVRVRVVLAQVANAATVIVRLFENIPVPTCTRTVCDARTPTTGARNRKSQPTTLKEVRTAGETRVELRSVMAPNTGLDVILPSGSAVSLMPHGLRDLYYGEELQIGRIEVDVEIPSRLGARSELAYVLRPQL